VEVGANVVGWGRNYRIGYGEWFVCEADEYNRSFWNYQCDIAVITNIEMDHPEFFRDYEEYLAAYQGFVEKMNGQKSLLIANWDSSGVKDLLRRVKIEHERLITYGKGEEAQYQLLSYKYNQSKGSSEFVIRYRDKEPRLIISALVGEHNALNALSVIAVAEYLGISIAAVGKMLANVRAPERRFEEFGQAQNGAILVNDYAHTPASILATIKAAKERYPGKIIWAVWQPHMYTRTKMLLDDFCKALLVADEIVVLPVFASRESGSELAKEISAGFLANKIGHKGYAAESIEDAANYLNNRTNSDAVIINMGAGDNSRIIDLMRGKLND
jgi:UDP-N-acetylmuramate--alanine ligase